MSFFRLVTAPLIDKLRKTFEFHWAFNLKSSNLPSYIFKFSGEIIIISLIALVSFFNWLYFSSKNDYSDRSHLAKFLSYHPVLNPKLYDRNAAIKIVVTDKGLIINQAFAESLNEDPSLIINSNAGITHNEDILTPYGLPGTNNLTDLKIVDDDNAEHKPFEYEVQAGDTLSSIAKKFDLNLNTILWANDLTAKTVINPGRKLILLPTDGVLHKVEKGDTISKIAALYKTETKAIIDYNGVDDATKIHAGDLIIVPGGQLQPKPKTTPSKPADSQNKVFVDSIFGRLIWPTTTKNITQRYSPSHRGIDIANGNTPPVYASHSGTVEFSGRDGAWGYTIVIRGDDGLATRYSHNSANYVQVGERVEAGQIIAQVGNTGRVRGRTGLHLDFRIYKNGVALNPLNFLK